MSTIVRKSDDVTGAYNPVSFLITLDTNERFDEFSSATKLTLIHEYAHYVQDVSTIYGLLNYISIVDYIQNARMFYTKIGRVDATLLHENLDNTIDYNSRCLRYARGDRDKPPGTYDNILHAEPKHWPEDEIVFQGLCVTLVNRLHEEHEFNLGALCIQENMAWLFEKKYGSTSNLDDFPYNIVSKTHELLFPKTFKWDSQPNNAGILQLIMCDLSLQFLYPGYYLYYIMEHAQQYDLDKTSVGQLYSDVFNMQFSNTRIVDNYVKYCDLAIESTKKLFKSEVTSKTAEWHASVLKKYKDLRLSHPEFLVDLFNTANGNNPKKLSEFLDEMGLPIIKNSLNEYGYFSKDDSYNGYLQYHLAAAQVFEILKGRYTVCVLDGFCENMGYHRDSTYCKNAQWKMIEKEELCPVAVLWKEWGLSELPVIQ